MGKTLGFKGYLKYGYGILTLFIGNLELRKRLLHVTWWNYGLRFMLNVELFVLSFPFWLIKTSGKSTKCIFWFPWQLFVSMSFHYEFVARLKKRWLVGNCKAMAWCAIAMMYVRMVLSSPMSALSLFAMGAFLGVSVILGKGSEEDLNQPNEDKISRKSESTLTVILLYCGMETYCRFLCPAEGISLLLLLYPPRGWGRLSGNFSKSKYHGMFLANAVHRH